MSRYVLYQCRRKFRNEWMNVYSFCWKSSLTSVLHNIQKLFEDNLTVVPWTLKIIPSSIITPSWEVQSRLKFVEILFVGNDMNSSCTLQLILYLIQSPEEDLSKHMLPDFRSAVKFNTCSSLTTTLAFNGVPLSFVTKSLSPIVSRLFLGLVPTSFSWCSLFRFLFLFGNVSRTCVSLRNACFFSFFPLLLINDVLL